jgi:poly(3-hydroxybutyrate) depolymerase
LQPPATTDNLSGRIVAFDQTEFAKGPRTSMSDKGFAYIPKACETAPCKVHIAIHGCLQYAKKLGDKYYNGTGYNEMADTNKIIVLYPQTQAGKPMNPQGCWDFWGYSDDDPNKPAFYTKNAPQMAAIMAMVKRLGESRQATE